MLKDSVPSSWHLQPTYVQSSVGMCEGILRKNGAVGLPLDRTKCFAANSASSNYRPEQWRL